MRENMRDNDWFFDNFDDQFDKHFDRVERNAGRIAKVAIGVWIAWALFCLAVVVTLVVCAIHFIPMWW